jgi:pyruvate/2-oxoacid:ferredoxin oxidoreductase beta subunit
MKRTPFDMGDIDIAWCPGCGNFKILDALKQALTELDLDPVKVVIVSGIGQAAKMPHYVRTNVFNGLHGRAIPAATGIKAANPELTVIAEGGDGDMYGEGGNHFLHAIRRNSDITNIVHNNMVYALTKGQASPTSTIGFNKVNTYQWFKESTYYLEDSHDPSDRMEAFRRATEKGKQPLGIFYRNPNRSCFEDTLPVYHKNRTPLFKREVDIRKLDVLIDSKRSG